MLLQREETADCARLLNGELRLPFITFEQPPESYGFPPNLIPFASDGSGPTYWGLLSDPFSPKPQSFVRLDLESLEVTEVARSQAQLLCYFTLLILDRSAPSEALSKYAELAGLRHTIGELDQLLQSCGGVREAALKLPEFEVLPPAFTGATRSEISPRDAFDSAFAQGNMQAAWAALCLSGWTFVAAREAFRRLVRNRQTGILEKLFHAWMSEHEETPGGY